MCTFEQCYSTTECRKKRRKDVLHCERCKRQPSVLRDGGDRRTPGEVMRDGARCITSCGVVFDGARRITSLAAVLHSFRRHIRPEGGTRLWAAAQWLLGKLVYFTMEVKSYEVAQRYASTGVENRGKIAFEFPLRSVL